MGWFYLVRFCLGSGACPVWGGLLPAVCGGGGWFGSGGLGSWFGLGKFGDFLVLSGIWFGAAWGKREFEWVPFGFWVGLRLDCPTQGSA